MKDILSEIVANKRFEIDIQKMNFDEEILKDHGIIVHTFIVQIHLIFRNRIQRAQPS